MNPSPEAIALTEPRPDFAPESAPLPSEEIFAELVAGVPMETEEANGIPELNEAPSFTSGDFLQAYGLRENPFADCVHPAFFFRTDGHAEAFRNMMLAVDFKTSLGLVTGPSGSGKTLLSQLLLQHFEQSRCEVILVLVTPGLSKTGLLREILAELGIALPIGISRVQDLVKLLSNHIIELHQQGRRLVIIIDESHLLSGDCLHVVRTISNIETPEQKLTTCLLFGESRLLHRLRHPSYESLQNRIYLRGELRSLDTIETAQYIKYRLMTAGRLTDLFTSGAFESLYRFSGGIPRTLNKLAMLCLIEGAVQKSAMIDENIVAHAAKRM